MFKKEIYYNIDAFDKNDFIFLSNKFKSIFKKDELLFFTGMREQHLTAWEDIEHLRPLVKSFFIEKGIYLPVKNINSNLFPFKGSLRFNEDTLNFIFKIWDYYVSLRFFSPSMNYTWDNFLLEKNMFLESGEEVNLLLLRKYNAHVAKNSDGDAVEIQYVNA